MKTEITCLCCEGQDVKANHQCAIGSTRGKLLRPLCQGVHRDFCQMCEKLLNKHFAKMLAPKPKPRLRLEDN